MAAMRGATVEAASVKEPSTRVAPLTYDADFKTRGAQIHLGPAESEFPDPTRGGFPRPELEQHTSAPAAV
jgi:hypothetical protein